MTLGFVMIFRDPWGGECGVPSWEDAGIRGASKGHGLVLAVT